MSSKTQYKAAITQQKQTLAQLKKLHQLAEIALQDEKRKVKNLEEALAEKRQDVIALSQEIARLNSIKWWQFWKV